jgi:hypothetical protein
MLCYVFNRFKMRGKKASLYAYIVDGLTDSLAKQVLRKKCILPKLSNPVYSNKRAFFVSYRKSSKNLF